MRTARSPAMPRRQARSESSRTRIVDAVARCVDRGGFAAATSAAIAREAGLSVGAVQHHYPAKNDMFDAVLAASAARFSACFDNAGPPADDLALRASEFIDRAWRHYGSAFFRAAQEIVLGARRQDRTPPRAVIASALVAEAVWHDQFGDLLISKAAHRDIRRASFAALTGLALMARFEPNASRLGGPLDQLKTGLTASLRKEVNRHDSSRSVRC